MKQSAVALFAVASILQLSHGIPTHRRLVRHASDIKEESGTPSEFQSYMPSMLSSYYPSQYGQYPTQFPSQMNPSQLSQYSGQLNPNQYVPSGSSAASSDETATAASEQQPSVAAKEGSSSSGGWQSYVPNQFNPSQLSQQYPSQFNPNQYVPSGSSAASSDETASAASEQQPSVAAKEGSSANGGWQSYVPSQFNPSQLGQQYPSQLPSPINYNQYLQPGGATSATPATSSSS